MINQKRFCGVLLHPTSFNSPYGIGDLGKEARETLTLLANTGISLWQILPLGPTGYGDSPYASRSTFAGNEFLIDIRSIEGYENCCGTNSSERIDYSDVYQNKMATLKEIAASWHSSHNSDPDFATFCKKNSWWLDDYALFQSLVLHFNDSRWFTWPEDIKMREQSAIDFWTDNLSDTISVFKVLQFFFFKQWNSLHAFANNLGIKIIGDIPIFVASDSVDAWSHRELFKIDEQGNQYAQAGVPPDGFSPTGQLWGNPVYNWSEHKKDDYKWFRLRLAKTLQLVDIVRIDHFRGFESYWEVPAGDTTAENGKWVPGPGMDLLKYFEGCNIIAEDLGVITKEVNDLRNEAKYPGMKILQFAFNFKNGEFESNHMYLPHMYPTNCVAYTGTHDNQTSRGWYNDQDEQTKDIIRRYLQCSDDEVVWQMIRSLMASHAQCVIFPIQDILGLDDNARMNHPSTVGSANWSWRLNPNDIQPWMLARLKEFIKLYGRAAN